MIRRGGGGRCHRIKILFGVELVSPVYRRSLYEGRQASRRGGGSHLTEARGIDIRVPSRRHSPLSPDSRVDPGGGDVQHPGRAQ